MAYNQGMDSYMMFKQCWDHQDNVEATQCSEVWGLLLEHKMVSRETTPITGHVLDPEGGIHPGAYRLDEVIPGGRVAAHA